MPEVTDANRESMPFTRRSHRGGRSADRCHPGRAESARLSVAASNCGALVRIRVFSCSRPFRSISIPAMTRVSPTAYSKSSVVGGKSSGRTRGILAASDSSRWCWIGLLESSKCGWSGERDYWSRAVAASVLGSTSVGNQTSQAIRLEMSGLSVQSLGTLDTPSNSPSDLVVARFVLGEVHDFGALLGSLGDDPQGSCCVGDECCDGV